MSIKGGLGPNLHPDGSPDAIKKSVDDSLAILEGTKSIDIFEAARVDKKVPVEVTLGALDEYVKAGKIGGVALSEVSAATVQRAVKVTKIVAVEVEVSLWSLDIFSNGVAKACAEHGIPVVAYVHSCDRIIATKLTGIDTHRSDVGFFRDRLKSLRISQKEISAVCFLVSNPRPSQRTWSSSSRLRKSPRQRELLLPNLLSPGSNINPRKMVTQRSSPFPELSPGLVLWRTRNRRMFN